MLSNDALILFALLRAGLGTETGDEGELFRRPVDWNAVSRLAGAQGVHAVAWDGLAALLDRGVIAPEYAPDRGLKLQWACNVEAVERLYDRQQRVLARLAAVLERHDIRLTPLKGYGLSRLYPRPNHRPCGDIDIWLWGSHKRADELFASEFGVEVESDKAHHSTFAVDGIAVENHSEFLNVDTPPSNLLVEILLRGLIISQPCEKVAAGDAVVYLPPPNFNAMYLLRHAAVHFIVAQTGIRHLVDWALFVGKYHDDIDWMLLHRLAREHNMDRFMAFMNNFAVMHLGFDAAPFPIPVDYDYSLDRRILGEILHPACPLRPDPKLWPCKVAYRVWRWIRNAWKYRITIKERPWHMLRLSILGRMKR